MQKDFDSWNEQKKDIQSKSFSKTYQERDIWWCAIGANIGVEQDGKNSAFERPVLVVKKFNSDMAWIVPMTSKNKSKVFYFPVEHSGSTKSFVLSQMRIVSTKRFTRWINRLSTYDFIVIKNIIAELLRFG